MKNNIASKRIHYLTLFFPLQHAFYLLVNYNPNKLDSTMTDIFLPFVPGVLSFRLFALTAVYTIISLDFSSTQSIWLGNTSLQSFFFGACEGLKKQMIDIWRQIGVAGYSRLFIVRQLKNTIAASIHIHVISRIHWSIPTFAPSHTHTCMPR